MNDALISLDRQQAESLARILRELEGFLDQCDDSVADVLDAHFGLAPASEAFSAALCFHADTLETALGSGERRHVMDAFATQKAR